MLARSRVGQFAGNTGLFESGTVPIKRAAAALSRRRIRLRAKMKDVLARYDERGGDESFHQRGDQQ